MTIVTSPMKTMISFLLALVILAGLAVPGFAASDLPEPEEESLEVAPLPQEVEEDELEEMLSETPEDIEPAASGSSEMETEDAESEDTGTGSDEPSDIEPEDVELEIEEPGTEDAEPQLSVMIPDQMVSAEPVEELDLSQFDPEDPLYYRMTSGVMTLATTSNRTTFSNYTPRATQNETLHKGIDVSAWQGTVDWKAVAADGVEFVIIRAAWKSSSTGKLSSDGRFVEYITGAKAAGLKVGAYVFSQAITEQEAREEAQFLMAMVDPYEIDLPLVLDFEYYSDATGNSGRLYNAKLSRQKATDICNAFCKEVEKYGYESMVYANPSMLTYQLYREQLGRLWLAHYTTKTSYSGQYEYWQCSGNGGVKGITGAVDLNFWFEPNGDDENPSTGEPPSTPVLKNPFEDVPRGAWYYDCVTQAYNEGIVKGITETRFYPGNTATRGQVVTMLYRLQGEPKVTAGTAFTDLTEDYYKDAVAWAASNGIVNGVSDTKFVPNQLITREQLVTMIYRMADSPKTSKDISAYSDAKSVSSYAKNAMAWAVEKGVITGYENNTLKPGASATRAEVCAILMRYKNL